MKAKPFSPEDTVISIADNKEAQQRVGDVDIEHKVQGVPALAQLLDELLDGVGGGVGVLRARVPDPVQVNPEQVTSVIAEINSVRIHHRNNLDKDGG